MSVDMFLKLGNIKGESTDPQHIGQISVLAFSWGEVVQVTRPAGGGINVSKPNLQDLSMTKYIDKASVPIMVALAGGTPILDATLTCRRNAATPYNFLTYVLNNVILSSVSEGGSEGEDQFTENISLNFQKITWTYRAVAGGTPIIGSYDTGTGATT